MARRIHGQKTQQAEAQTVIGQADRLLEGMNPEQTAAILHTSGPLGVFAGAGSGKTRVIIHRVANLIRSGVAPDRILAVTFSKNAADEMKERGRKLGLDAEFRTWHSLALHILRADETPWKSWTIDDKDRAKLALRDVVGYKGLDWVGVDISALQSFIGFCKSQLWRDDGEPAFEYARGLFGHESPRAMEAFRRYNRELKERQLLTFDDMLVFCHQWLTESGAVDRWAARWDYILQDEAQDASPAQLQIAQLLAQGHQNYCVVGDPAQSIYKFRGSDPAFLLRFATEWGGATVINMHRNYRCGKSIIELANAVIRPSTNRLSVDIAAELPHDGMVTWRQVETLDVEGGEVAGEIETHINAGAAPASIAVLYRLNAQSRGIEEALLNHKIPYVVVGGCSFYERKEVKDLLAYLRLLVGRDVKGSVRRALNAPFRYLGAAYLEKVLMRLGAGTTLREVVDAVLGACDDARVQHRQRSSAREFTALLSACAVMAGVEGTKPDAILERILSVTQYEAWLKKSEGEENLESSHIANVKELVRVAGRFSTVQELVDFVDATIEESTINRNAAGDRVLLMSIHKSKGLEFEHVCLIGATEMVLPHPRNEDQDEERRLMYVAVTRAKQTLFITSPRFIATRRGVIEVEPSRFVREAGLVGPGFVDDRE